MQRCPVYLKNELRGILYESKVSGLSLTFFIMALASWRETCETKNTPYAGGGNEGLTTKTIPIKLRFMLNEGMILDGKQELYFSSNEVDICKCHNPVHPEV